MTFRFRQVVAVSMLAMGGLAQAAYVDVPAGTPSPYDGFTYQGALALTYGADILGAWDTFRASVSSYGAGMVTASRDTDGFFAQMSQTAPMSSVTVDSGTGALARYDSVGGTTITVPALKSVTSGGSLTLTDLSVDFKQKQVNATIIGANGVGTLTNFHLLDIQSITLVGAGQGCPAFGDCAYPRFTASGLILTAEGYNKISQSLGLQQLGRAAIWDPIDFGVLTTVAIPEPSTYTLMGVGLLGVWGAAKRRRARL